MTTKKFLNLVSLFALACCTMEPKYLKPQTQVPLQEADKSKRKVATIAWQEYFETADLQRVIKLALENNRDLRVANLNIESAQATHGIVRSNLLPTINAVGSETRQGVPSAFAGFMPKRQFRANLTLTSYEVDFFGRLRSLKKSALEDFLASEEARNVTRISLISETVNAYTQYLLDSEVLKIAEENLKTQEDRYKYSELRFKHGINSQTDLLAASAITETARISYETYKKLVAKDKSALMLLTGVFDEISLPQIKSVNEIKINEDLLDLVPSESLLARPDIQQAEHDLKSANANIGAARAAFFPSITLSGNYGYASRDLSTLFDSKTWAFTPQISMPLFAGGRNINNLKLADLRKKVEIAQYEKAIQTAFREVSDQLAERESVRNQLKSYEEVVSFRKKYLDIFENKHVSGIGSAVDVLDAQVDWFTAQLNQANIKKEYIANLVSLYKVLGGGNEVEDVEKK